MNPLIGSFEVSERNQIMYATFACMMPGPDDLRTIYKSILDGHCTLRGFDKKVTACVEFIAEASIHLHQEVAHKFLPSAIKFVYNWNMRELANIFQGLCLATADNYPKPIDLCRLWLHESYRVFSDRMVSEADFDKFSALVKEVTHKEMHNEDQDVLHGPDLIFTAFEQSTGAGEPKYLPIKSSASLNQALESSLIEYNESNTIMELVLFQAAMEHV